MSSGAKPLSRSQKNEALGLSGRMHPSRAMISLLASLWVLIIRSYGSPAILGPLRGLASRWETSISGSMVIRVLTLCRQLQIGEKSASPGHNDRDIFPHPGLDFNHKYLIVAKSSQQRRSGSINTDFAFLLRNDRDKRSGSK